METKRKTMLGLVVSDNLNKTVVVAVETPRRHPLYKKTVRRVVNYKAHDEENKCQKGDKVRIIETRPLSRDKRWRVAEIVVKGEMVEISPEEISREDLAKVVPEKKAKEEVTEVKAEEETKEETEAEAKVETKKKAKKETEEEAKKESKEEVKEETGEKEEPGAKAT
jgi:small subunit ribosomal protein S17